MIVRGLTLVLVLATCVSCVRAYQPPTAGEPHAVLKLRRTYEQGAGVHLREIVDIDRHRAYALTSPASLASTPRMDSILVHPVPATAAVTSKFFHTEWQLVRESYTEQEPYYTTESYDCSTGYGTSRSHRTCTRSVTRYRSVTKYRMVNREVEIPDGECNRTLRFAPAVGRVYLLQFTYGGHQACQLSCFEQLPLPGGEFQNVACAVPPPED
jgi:hypothetical protein